MSFLTTLSDVAAGASSVGTIAGVAKGVSGLLGLGGNQQRQQYKYQKKLMAYQNQLNQQNSLIDYQRQRQLTADNPMLQKIGLRNAGMNTAMGDGSTASAASVGSTSPSSTPSPLPTDAQIDSQYSSMVSQFGSLSQSSRVADADIRVKNAQAKNQEIKNSFEIDQQIEQLESLHNSNKISDAEYKIRMENLRRLQDTHDSYVKQEDEKANQAELDTKNKQLQNDNQQIQNDILSITKQLNVEQLKQAKFVTEHQYELYLKQLEEISSRVKANNASAAASFASAALAKSQAAVANVQAELERAKIPYAADLAKYTMRLAANNATKAYNDAVIAGYGISGAKREAQYQEYARREEDSWIGRNIFYSLRADFENSVGLIFGAVKK